MQIGPSYVIRSTVSLLLILVIFCGNKVFAQDTVRVVTYNVLNYPGSTGDIRDPHLINVLDSINAHIIVVEEIIGTSGFNRFRDSVVDKLTMTYAAGTFINGFDTDKALFYDSTKFSFTSNTAIATTLRDINEFTLTHTATGHVVRFYAVHLKASQGAANENQREGEVDSLRQITDSLPVGHYTFVLGDFNIYGSDEAAYVNLLNDNGSTEGHFHDPISITGTWNNSSYAKYHTQSPRTRSFGGGSTGGMDDRFDMILFSEGINTPGGVDYLVNSCSVLGNDSLHYNDSVNNMPNAAASQTIADALHYGSDHLPVFADFVFSSLPLYVDMTDLVSEYKGEVVAHTWTTFVELNHKHFQLQHSADAFEWETVKTIPGKGAQDKITDYTVNTAFESGYYRLAIEDIDGHFDYSNVTFIDDLHSSQQVFPTITDRYLYFNPPLEQAFVILSASGEVLYHHSDQMPIEQLDLDWLSQGSYLIQMLDTGEYFRVDKL